MISRLSLIKQVEAEQQLSANLRRELDECNTTINKQHGDADSQRLALSTSQAAVAAKLNEQQHTIRTLQAQLGAPGEAGMPTAEPSEDLVARHRQELEKVEAAKEKAISMERLKTQALLLRAKELERQLEAATCHGAAPGT